VVYPQKGKPMPLFRITYAVDSLKSADIWETNYEEVMRRIKHKGENITVLDAVQITPPPLEED
tara:strand:- start:16 stop:204 length:189 start_codon:yes stop_codon:yes gene_type:complete